MLRWRLYPLKGSLNDVRATQLRGASLGGSEQEKGPADLQEPLSPSCSFSESYSEQPCLFSQIVPTCALTLTPDPPKVSLGHHTGWAYGLRSDTQTGFLPISHSDRNTRRRERPALLGGLLSAPGGPAACLECGKCKIEAQTLSQKEEGKSKHLLEYVV